MLVSADLHLGDDTDCIDIDGYPSKLIDTKQRLLELIQVAADLKESVVLAGDIFDSTYPKPYVIECLFHIFRCACELNVDITVLPGNHDCDVKWNSLVVAASANFHNIKVVTEPTLRMDNILLLPHIPKKNEQLLFEHYKVHNYEELIDSIVGTKKGIGVITHAQVNLGSSSTEREMEAGNAIPLNVGAIKSKLKYIILGHVHQSQKLIHPTWKYPIYYCGSVVPHTFGEGDDPLTALSYLHIVGKEITPILFKSEIHEYKTIRLHLEEKKFTVSDSLRQKIAKLENKLLKLVIYCKSRDEIDESLIRSTFSRNVMRFEYELVQPESKKKTKSIQKDVVFSELDHVQLLDDYLTEHCTKKVRDKALEIGKEIIQCCKE